MTKIHKKGGKLSCLFSVYRQSRSTKMQEKCFESLLGEMAQKNSFKTAARSPASLPQSAAISVMDSRTISPKLLPRYSSPSPRQRQQKKASRSGSAPGRETFFLLCCVPAYSGSGEIRFPAVRHRPDSAAKLTCSCWAPAGPCRPCRGAGPRGW